LVSAYRCGALPLEEDRCPLLAGISAFFSATGEGDWLGDAGLEKIDLILLMRVENKGVPFCDV
jgi:hypothetical protein